MSDKQHPEFVKGYLMGVAHADSLHGAVRALAAKTNEHALVLFALCKKLNTTPQELVETLTPEDFVNPADTPQEEPKEPTNGSLILPG